MIFGWLIKLKFSDEHPAIKIWPDKLKLELPASVATVPRMNLEDHLGDIIAKARAMSSVTAAAAAKAVGISEAELAALESSGKFSKRPDFAALAGILGLDAKKLAGIADGWLPAAKDMSQWRELRVFTSSGEGITVNCYLAWDEVTLDAALFDTGFDSKPILDTIAAEGLVLRHIFITHSHHDHVHALGVLREAFPKVRIHTSSKNAPVDQRNKTAEIVHLGGLRVTYRETPGHAEDGVTYLIGNWQEDAPHVAVVGDAIFAGSMGRGNQSWELARQKVREQILSLPTETLLCPGHGPLTSVEEEQGHNPFF
jgi:glyoxylase-like metal-dependent hydrolase (beta-lactamase superfamily II)